MSYGKIISVEEVNEIGLAHVSPMNGDNGSQLGIGSMIHRLMGSTSMDGYKVTTDSISVHILIDNYQSCCESWGYVSSDDDFAPFIGAELREVKLTDVALNQQVVDNSGDYDDGGGIQFVDFVTDKGTFQLAVYNAHNGYYGHGILIALGDDIICNDTL